MDYRGFVWLHVVINLCISGFTIFTRREKRKGWREREREREEKCNNFWKKFFNGSERNWRQIAEKRCEMQNGKWKICFNTKFVRIVRHSIVLCFVGCLQPTEWGKTKNLGEERRKERKKLDLLTWNRYSIINSLRFEIIN